MASIEKRKGESEGKPTPVFLLSHGTPLMLGEESEPQRIWEEIGKEMTNRKVSRIVIMGAHWMVGGGGVQVAMNAKASKHPPGGVSDSRWIPYKLITDIEGGHRVLQMLNNAGIKATPDYKWDWIHDTYNVLIRMFPHCVPPPTTVVSLNAFYDPHLHAKIGLALRPLRYENTVIIGSAGTVHNLWRARWIDQALYLDNFSMPTPPEEWALQFRQAFVDAIMNNRGPALRRALTRLMKHPRYREAHGTDDHYMANVFCAGAAGDAEDVDSENFYLGENWELINQSNVQFQLGKWD